MNRIRAQAEAAAAEGDTAKARRLFRWADEADDSAARLRKARACGVRPIDLTEFGPGGKVLPFKGGAYDT